MEVTGDGAELPVGTGQLLRSDARLSTYPAVRYSKLILLLEDAASHQLVDAQEQGSVHEKG